MAKLGFDIFARDEGASRSFNDLATAMDKTALAADRLNAKSLATRDADLKAQAAKLQLVQARQKDELVQRSSIATDDQKAASTLRVQQAALKHDQALDHLRTTTAAAGAAAEDAGHKAERSGGMWSKLGETARGSGGHWDSLKTSVGGVRQAIESPLKMAAGFVGVVGVAGVAAGAVGLAKAAADQQAALTTLVTGAGESEKALAGVGKGIIAISGDVGSSVPELTKGLYLIESAGYHGAAGLTVLKVAAEGAKVGNASLATEADAVTSALNAYHLPASKAAEVTNILTGTVSAGKLHLQDLAGSLGGILPVASLAHIRLAEIGGAIATMTSQGTPAADAVTYLRQTVAQLENPTGKAAKEMQSLGINSVDISEHLGTRGLAGTLNVLTSAIEQHMGPAGTVLIEHLAKIAKNTTAYQQALANLPPTQQTYIGALAQMVGGTKSMQAALELTGPNMSVFQSNTDAIAKSAQDAGSNVAGWSLVNEDFNTKMDKIKETVHGVGLTIGTALMPMLGKAADALSKDVPKGMAWIEAWWGRNKTTVETLAKHFELVGINVAKIAWKDFQGFLTYVGQWWASNSHTVERIGSDIGTVVVWLGKFTLGAFKTFMDWAPSKGLIEGIAAIAALKWLTTTGPIKLAVNLIGSGVELIAGLVGLATGKTSLSASIKGLAGGGAASLETRGATPARPLYVDVVGGGGGAGRAGGGLPAAEQTAGAATAAESGGLRALAAGAGSIAGTVAAAGLAAHYLGNLLDKYGVTQKPKGIAQKPWLVRELPGLNMAYTDVAQPLAHAAGNVAHAGSNANTWVNRLFGGGVDASLGGMGVPTDKINAALSGEKNAVTEVHVALQKYINTHKDATGVVGVMATAAKALDARIMEGSGAINNSFTPAMMRLANEVKVPDLKFSAAQRASIEKSLQYFPDITVKKIHEMEDIAAAGGAKTPKDFATALSDKKTIVKDAWFQALTKPQQDAIMTMMDSALAGGYTAPTKLSDALISKTEVVKQAWFKSLTTPAQGQILAMIAASVTGGLNAAIGTGTGIASGSATAISKAQALALGINQKMINKLKTDYNITVEVVDNASAVLDHFKTQTLARDLPKGISYTPDASGGYQKHVAFAAGGKVPGHGHPTADDVLARLSSGEWVIPKDAVDKYGQHFMTALQHKRFAAGGSVHNTTDSFGLTFDPAGLSAMFSGMLPSTPSAVAGFDPGMGALQWGPVALQALALAHEPVSWLTSLLRRMNQESGGNPRAINLWDSNAAAGDPSRGLMQTTGSTFRTFAGSLASRGIYDPLANIYASIEYAVAAYGSGPAGWDRAGGYASGGLVFDGGGTLAPGWNRVLNSTGSAEHLVPVGAGGMGNITIIINGPVYGDARAFVKQVTPLVRQELRDALKREGRPVTV